MVLINTFLPASLLLLVSCISESSQGHHYHPTPYALSPVYLEYLENAESQLYHLLKEKTVDDSAATKDVLNRYVSEYEQNVQNHMNSTDNASNLRNAHHHVEVVSNPILALQLIGRFVKYFKNDSFALVAQDLLDMDKGAIPSGKEIEDAMGALLRVQHVYDLDAIHLVEGIFGGVATPARLTARECYEIARYAQGKGYFTLALQWYDTAMQMLKYHNIGKRMDTTRTGLKPNMILRAMKDVVEKHNEDYETGMKDDHPYLFSTPIHTTNYSAISHLTVRKRVAEEWTGKFVPETDPKFYEPMEANTHALCLGKSLQSEKAKARLKCWLDTKRHPYWTINPLKIEVLHEKPQVIQLYDIFSDRWIAYLKEKSYLELKRAPQPIDSTSTTRTAAYAWFDDVEIPETPVSKTIEFITGLNVVGPAAAEALQVAAYAFGGHVEPHCDSRDDPESNPRGDRVTTFLIYLNDVERGGLTAFPFMGFHVKPVKNSAVLWYTNYKNGAVDERTMHAACPVITGQKWIATKWTHINSNIFKRPCGLKEYE